VDIRHVDLGIARRPDRRDGLALGDAVIGGDRQRPEVEERDRVPVRGFDRHRATVDGEPACEGHAASGGRAHGRAGVGSDVDSRVTVLAVLLAAELEAMEDGSVDRPRPRCRRRGGDEREQNARHCCCCHFRQHRVANLASRSAVVKIDYSERR
jgi:hypothetical protein